MACFGHRFVSAPSPQRWAGYMAHPFWCQRPKMTKTTFFVFRRRRPVEKFVRRPGFPRVSAHFRWGEDFCFQGGTAAGRHVESRFRRAPPPSEDGFWFLTQPAIAPFRGTAHNNFVGTPFSLDWALLRAAAPSGPEQSVVTRLRSDIPVRSAISGPSGRPPICRQRTGTIRRAGAPLSPSL